MEDEVDISQLLAFADSIDISTLDEVPEMIEIREVPWSTPCYMRGCPTNMYSSMVISTVSGDQDMLMDSSSPPSPMYKTRASLFGNSEQALSIELCGENTDPRSVCIVDQPGRYAQFKHWIQAGVIIDDTRRITKKEDSWQVGCWLADETSNAESSKSAVKAVTSLDRLLLNRTKATHIDSNVSRGLYSATGATPRQAEYVNRSLEETWKEKSFLLGAQIMVSMNSSNLTSELFPRWCLWFNDKLCEWGLGDRVAHSANSSGIPHAVNADIDLSHNDIGDAAVSELLSLLGAFQRVRVKTLRLSDTGLSDAGLVSLGNLPYLQHLVVQSNFISAAGVVGFAEKELVHKQEFYEVLLAQDAPDEHVLEPLYMMVEFNQIDGGLALVKHLNEIKLPVCIPDSMGCQPLGICRTLGHACRLHICGLGCQSIRP